ncbi:MAG: hypothetical protein KJ874_11995 [Acidobacteria bacterium]|nr:hypothetical protein [Acidobacteriota bacterium]
MADKRNRDNPTNRLNTVLDVIETAGRLRSSTVIVAGGDRIDDVELVESARDHGFVDRIILVGDKKRIHQIIGDLGIEIPQKDILQAEGNEEIAALTVRTALEEDIDILLKGRVTTGALSRDMLRLANRPTTSLVTLLDSSAIGRGRPILMSDPAITTITNYGRLTGIIRNAVDVAQTVLEIEKPRVAVLSAYEGVIASLPSTQTALALSSLDWQDAYVCGPLSFDLATSAEVLEIKGKPDLLNAGEVAGRADVLICPNIETANVLYKAISAQARFGNASMANIAVGFDVSYGIISRADSLETRLTSIALCSVFAQRTREKPHTHRKSVVVSEKTSTVLAVDPELEHLQVAVYKGGRRIREDTLPVTELTDGIHVDWDRQIHAWTRTLKERLGRAASTASRTEPERLPEKSRRPPRTILNWWKPEEPCISEFPLSDVLPKNGISPDMRSNPWSSLSGNGTGSGKATTSSCSGNGSFRPPSRIRQSGSVSRKRAFRSSLSMVRKISPLSAWTATGWMTAESPSWIWIPFKRWICRRKKRWRSPLPFWKRSEKQRPFEKISSMP